MTRKLVPLLAAMLSMVALVAAPSAAHADATTQTKSLTIATHALLNQTVYDAYDKAKATITSFTWASNGKSAQGNIVVSAYNPMIKHATPAQLPDPTWWDPMTWSWNQVPGTDTWFRDTADKCYRGAVTGLVGSVNLDGAVKLVVMFGFKSVAKLAVGPAGWIVFGVGGCTYNMINPGGW